MVEKLNDMLQHRYGKGLSIRHLMGVGQDLNQEVTIKGEDLYIPIFVKDIFLGYGLVHEARDLSSSDTTHIARLVRMILEPHLYSQHLERTLNNSEIERSSAFEAVETAESSKAISLFGNAAARIQKIAMEIHEITRNWSYLPFKDVNSQIKSLEDFKSLKGSTLVVDTEAGIDQATENLLADYLKSHSEGPLLIFVGSKSARHQKALGSDLQQLLTAFEYSVDRLPLDKQALNEVLEMMYFKS